MKKRISCQNYKDSSCHLPDFLSKYSLFDVKIVKNLVFAKFVPKSEPISSNLIPLIVGIPVNLSGDIKIQNVSWMTCIAMWLSGVIHIREFC